jgi:acyl-CoA thioester hydrolase
VRRLPRRRMSLPLETWRGSVNAWECDENLHMNVRFFGSRAMEGLGFMAAALDMPRAFQEKASSTLQPTDLHIRFLKEARQGVALSMRGGVAALDAASMTVFQEMAHADGKPAANFAMKVAHVHPPDLRAFPLPARVRTRAEALKCAIPAHGLPRSLDLSIAPTSPTVALADKLGAPVVGRVAVTPDHCDPFGRMRMELFLGRVSDAVPNFLAAWREQAANADGARTVGGAVLEYRLCPRRWPRAGDLIEIRSGVVDVAEKTNRLVHWLLDPVSGDAWCTAEVVAVTFDLVTRKTIPIPEARRALLLQRAVKGMTI